MIFVYSILIKIYGGIIFLVSFFNRKAKLWIGGRKDWKNFIRENVSKKDNIIWIHCASLGEFEQGRPVLEELKKKYRGYKILLTFFSPSGYEVRKNYVHADLILYMPLDTKNNAETFLKLVNPKIVIFVKYEFWFNFIKEIKNKNIPLFVISAVFRKSSVFFKWYGKWCLKYLNMIKIIFVQDRESQEILNDYNIKSVLSGDTRFDRVLEIKNENQELSFVNKFKSDNFLVVAGSTWSTDEKYLINVINNDKSNNKFLIAPHNLDKKNISNLIKKLTVDTIRFTSVENDDDISKYKVLILDTMGILTKVYKYSDLTYIGGGFQKGIHNILEPAVYGNPIIIGPKYKKFIEAVELVKKKGIIVVKNELEFKLIFEQFLDGKKSLYNESKICSDFVLENKNAKEIIIDKISESIND